MTWLGIKWVTNLMWNRHWNHSGFALYLSLSFCCWIHFIVCCWYSKPICGWCDASSLRLFLMVSLSSSFRHCAFTSKSFFFFLLSLSLSSSAFHRCISIFIGWLFIRAVKCTLCFNSLWGFFSLCNGTKTLMVHFNVRTPNIRLHKRNKESHRARL